MDGVTVPVHFLFRLARLPLLRGPARRAISWLGAKALAGPAAELRHALPVLPEASKDLERRYLALGNALEELAGIAAELVDASRHVVVMASGRETGEADFERTLAVLATPSEFLSLALAELPEVAGSLSRASSLAARLVALEQALEQTLAPLRFTQLMLSVESATLSEQARESFGTLTCQIGALHQRVQGAIRQHFDALLETRNSLIRAVTELEQFSSLRMSELRERRARLQQTLEHLAGQVRETARRDVQLTQTSGAMAAQVNRAVTAMQTQDIVAQKLEHASRGLGEVADAVQEIGSGDGVQCLHRVSTVARVELAQLDATNDELARSQAVLSEAISGILARLNQMDAECLMLHEFQNITASVDGTAQVLIDSIDGLREMTTDTLRMTRRLEEILRPVESATDIVTGSVSEVAAEIHRIALNAQVHAVQTGARTGLEVLAEHIAGLAGDTLRINAQLCAGLAESAGEMTASTSRLARLRQSGEHALRVCNQDAQREEDGLHAFRDRVLAELHRVGALLDRARQESSGMLANLDLNSGMEHILSVRRRVDQLALAAEASTPPMHPGERYGEAAGLTRRYTMASERHTHRKVLQALQTGAPAHQPVSESELGANIELF
jgi:methyl-accepting chemotaxis protein